MMGKGLRWRHAQHKQQATQPCPVGPAHAAVQRYRAHQQLVRSGRADMLALTAASAGRTAVATLGHLQGPRAACYDRRNEALAGQLTTASLPA